MSNLGELPNLPPDNNMDNEEGDYPVWTYQGYRMRHAEFNTAWVHYYRAEIQRCNTWRTRLDATTNWAVLTVAAAISFSISSPGNHYGVIILDTLLVTLFLWIEARRYRYYELWSYRARLLEINYFAAMLVPPFKPAKGWAEAMAESLNRPKFSISMLEAFGRRLRRNYLLIYLILGSTWALKSYIHPFPAVSIDQFIDRSALGSLPGLVLVIIGLTFNGSLFLIALFTLRLHDATGEVGDNFNVHSLSD
ncbi:MAG: hypothetical protein JWP00_1087 [Chloroflexi bacterium]|jgi:uncharacterized membrane protein|nr:hypothetical protein [Chloroflexota bacterium]